MPSSLIIFNLSETFQMLIPKALRLFFPPKQTTYQCIVVICPSNIYIQFLVTNSEINNALLSMSIQQLGKLETNTLENGYVYL